MNVCQGGVAKHVFVHISRTRWPAGVSLSKRLNRHQHQSSTRRLLEMIEIKEAGNYELDLSVCINLSLLFFGEVLVSNTKAHRGR